MKYTNQLKAEFESVKRLRTMPAHEPDPPASLKELKTKLAESIRHEICVIESQYLDPKANLPIHELRAARELLGAVDRYIRR